jgi:hypothetical protein
MHSIFLAKTNWIVGEYIYNVCTVEGPLFCKAAGGPFYLLACQNHPAWKMVQYSSWLACTWYTKTIEQEYLQKTNFLLSLEMAPTPSPAS